MKLSFQGKIVDLKLAQMLTCIITLFVFMRLFSMDNIISPGSRTRTLYVIVSELLFLTVSVQYLWRRKISPFFLMLLLYSFWGVWTTLVGGGSLKVAIRSSYPILAMCMYNELQFRKNRGRYLYSYTLLLTILASTNFVLIPFSQGLFGEFNYYMGGRNQLAIPCIFSVVISRLAYEAKAFKSKKIVYYNLIVATINILAGGSKGGLFAWSFFLLLYYGKIMREIIVKIGYLNTAVMLAGIQVGVVFFRIHEYLSFLIEDVMNRSLTLTRRTLVWDQAIEKVMESPVWGYGVPGNPDLFTVDYLEHGLLKSQTLSAHNEMLRILYEHGILAIVFLTAIFFVCWISSYKKRRETCIYILFAACFALDLQMFSEAPGMNGIMVLLSLIYCCSIYEERKNDT